MEPFAPSPLNSVFQKSVTPPEFIQINRSKKSISQSTVPSQAQAQHKMWPHRFRFCVFKEYLLKLILRRYIVSLVFMDSSIHNFESLVKGNSDDMWSFKVMDEKLKLLPLHQSDPKNDAHYSLTFDKTPIFQSPISFDERNSCGSMDGWPKTIGRQCKPRSPNCRFTLKIPRKRKGESIEPKHHQFLSGSYVTSLFVPWFLTCKMTKVT